MKTKLVLCLVCVLSASILSAQTNTQTVTITPSVGSTTAISLLVAPCPSTNCPPCVTNCPPCPPAVTNCAVTNTVIYTNNVTNTVYVTTNCPPCPPATNCAPVLSGLVVSDDGIGALTCSFSPAISGICTNLMQAACSHLAGNLFVVHGRRATQNGGVYQGIGNTITLYDVTTIVPRFLSRLESGSDTPGWPFIAGNRLFVASGPSGFRIFDISNLSAPTLISTVDTPGFCTSIWIDGNTAYVGDNTAGVRIYDVTNPSAVTFTGSYDTAGGVKYVTVVGTTAYVADNNALVILNVSNKATPTLLSTTAIQTSLHVSVQGGIAYVSAGVSGTKVFNVSSPSSPALIATIPMTTGNFGGATVATATASNRLYTACGLGGVAAYDVSNPSVPILLGSTLIPSGARGVHVKP